MKKYLLILGASLFLLAFSACGSEDPQQNFDFDEKHFLPETATDVEVFKLDIDDDGLLEAAMYYKNYDQLDVEVFANQEHIELYKDVDYNGWELMFEKVVSNDPSTSSITQALRIVSHEVVDIANDGKDELLVAYNLATDSGNSIIDYDLFCIQNGKIGEVKFPRSYSREGEPTEDLNGTLVSLDVVDGEIVEKFGVLCEGGESPCFTYELVISHDHEKDKWNLSEPKNKKKIESEWKAYQERYPDALEWTDELPF